MSTLDHKSLMYTYLYAAAHVSLVTRKMQSSWDHGGLTWPEKAETTFSLLCEAGSDVIIEESVALFHISDCSDSVMIYIDVAIFWLHVDMVWSITFDFNYAYSNGQLLKNKGHHQWKKQKFIKGYHQWKKQGSSPCIILRVGYWQEELVWAHAGRFNSLYVRLEGFSCNITTWIVGHLYWRVCVCYSSLTCKREHSGSVSFCASRPLCILDIVVTSVSTYYSSAADYRVF